MARGRLRGGLASRIGHILRKFPLKRGQQGAGNETFGFCVGCCGIGLRGGDAGERRFCRELCQEAPPVRGLVEVSERPRDCYWLSVEALGGRPRIIDGRGYLRRAHRCRRARGPRPQSKMWSSVRPRIAGVGAEQAPEDRRQSALGRFSLRRRANGERRPHRVMLFGRGGLRCRWLRRNGRGVGHGGLARGRRQDDSRRTFNRCGYAWRRRRRARLNRQWSADL